MTDRLFFVLLLCLSLTACERTSPDALPTSEPVESSEALESEPLTFASWHRDRLLPFESPADLDPIVELARDRSLILLGNATEGTTDFANLRGILTLKLAREHGLDFIALEADGPSVRPLNDFVLGRGDERDLDSLLIESFHRWPKWRWATREFRDFLIELRQYNADIEHPVQLHGLDVGAPYEAIDDLHELLDAHLEEAVRAPIKRDLRCLTQFASLLHYGRAVHNQSHPHGHAHDHDHGHDHNEPPAFIVDGARDCGPAITRMFTAVSDAFPGKAPHEVDARNTARVILGADDQVRSQFNPKFGEYWNVRIRAMYDIVKNLLRHGDNARGVIWAHNLIVGDGRATYFVDQNQNTLGELLREDDELGPDAVLLLGTTTYTGSVMASPREEEPGELMQLPEAKQDSLEARLFRLRPNGHILLFEPEDANLPFFQVRQPHRSIGAVYRPDREHFVNYVATIPPKRYDGLIFLPNTVSITKLE